METWILAVPLWLISIACGYAIGRSRNNVAEGVGFPLILGPVGLLLAFVLVKPPREEVRP